MSDTLEEIYEQATNALTITQTSINELTRELRARERARQTAVAELTKVNTELSATKEQHRDCMNDITELSIRLSKYERPNAYGKDGGPSGLGPTDFSFLKTKQKRK